MYLGTMGALVVVVLVIGHDRDSPLVNYAAMASIVAVLFVDGAFLAALVSWSAFRGRNQLLSRLLLPPTVWAARSITAATFLMVGSSKLITYNTYPFFQASGYSKAFYIFVCIFECVCAIGLMMRLTVIPTILALWVEMVGAIYTHFHNYFARGLPNPFGNSLEALRMLVILGFIAFAIVAGRGQGWRNKLFLQSRSNQPKEVSL
jgi:hypothetical protein